MSRIDTSASRPLLRRGLSSAERFGMLTAVWIACVLFVCSLTIADPDLWGHTLYGLRAVQQGVWFERTDPFSYTAAGAPWFNHEWLTEYQFGWLWQRWGNAGLSMWRNAAVLVVFVAAGVSLWRAGASVAAGTCLLIFSTEALSEFVVFVRPQLATFALFAVSLMLLRAYWDRPRLRLIVGLPLLTAVWVNLHGGFLAGLGLQAVFLAAFVGTGWKDRSRRRPACVLAVVFGLSLLATLANPYGSALHVMLWHHLSSAQFVREWQPLWAVRQSPVYYAPFLLIALALLRIRRWEPVDLLVLGVVGFQAVCHIRHVALLTIAAMILLPGPLSESFERLLGTVLRQWSAHGFRRRRLAAIAAVIAMLSALQVRSTWTLWQEGIAPWDVAVQTESDVPGVPLRAVALMKREGLAGNLVTDYGWGQFVLWHLSPDVKVAFDGRYRTVYPPTLEREFLDFQRADDDSHHVPLLDRYKTEMALLPAGRGPCSLFDRRDDWVLVFGDDQSRLYVADVPKFRDLIARSQRKGLIVPRVPVWESFPGSLRLGMENAVPSRHLAWQRPVNGSLPKE